MSVKYGYEQIKKIAFFGLAFGEAMADSNSQVGALAKASAFLACLDEGVELLSIDRELLKAEFKDFDQEDREDLFAECAIEFDLADDALEERIEASISAALKILAGIEGAVAAWKAGAA